MKKLIIAVSLVFLTVGVAHAVDPQPKDTLIVERYTIVQNGTSSGKNLSTHAFTVRKSSPTECTTSKDIYNAENLIVVGGLYLEMKTVARCEAVNYSITN